MLYVGTSGWQYRDWKGAFYPDDLPQREWLPYYAQRFATVELNNSFYHLPEASSFERWRDVTPDDLVVAVKMSRYLTHLKRLRDPAEPVSRFFERALATWAERIASLWPAGADVFCYFNNDTRACAVRDAITFARLARRVGLRPTRVPQPSEVRVRTG